MLVAGPMLALGIRLFVMLDPLISLNCTSLERLVLLSEMPAFPPLLPSLSSPNSPLSGPHLRSNLDGIGLAGILPASLTDLPGMEKLYVNEFFLPGPHLLGTAPLPLLRTLRTLYIPPPDFQQAHKVCLDRFGSIPLVTLREATTCFNVAVAAAAPHRPAGAHECPQDI